MSAAILLLAALFTLGGWQINARADGLFNEQGYRIKSYRRATPEVAPAGQRLDTAGLQRLISERSPILIDVQAITLRPETAEFGFTWLPSAPRYHIPGSTWLPNVGYGELKPLMFDYLVQNLERLSGGDKSRPMVFYCVLDCWMSWNVVRRAADLGYSNLYWYPEGSDGWRDAGLELVEATPYPLSVAQFFTPFERLDLRELLNQANASERDLLLFFETAHCPYCKRMRNTVLLDDDVISRLAGDFIAIAVDMQSHDDMIDAHGRATSMAAFSSRAQRVVRTPTMLFFDAEFNLLHRHSGLVATRDEMLRLLDFVDSRAYEIQSWQSFKRGN